MSWWACRVALVLGLTLTALTSGLEERLEHRLIGGVQVSDQCRPPFTWMVAVQITSPSGPVTFCSSVMLDNRTLITAGRCISGLVTDKKRTGLALFGQLDSDKQVIPISRVRLHPDFQADTADNDLALVRLSQPVGSSPCVTPATKMEEDATVCPEVDMSCVMAGWGPDSESKSRVLRSALVTVYGDFVTRQLELARTHNPPARGALYVEATDPRQQICASAGGAVVSCVRNGKNVLRGVVSEHDCHGKPATPMMVTNVQDFQHWIDACQLDWESPDCSG